MKQYKKLWIHECKFYFFAGFCIWAVVSLIWYSLFGNGIRIQMETYEDTCKKLAELISESATGIEPAQEISNEMFMEIKKYVAEEESMAYYLAVAEMNAFVMIGVTIMQLARYASQSTKHGREFIGSLPLKKTDLFCFHYAEGGISIGLVYIGFFILSICKQIELNRFYDRKLTHDIDNIFFVLFISFLTVCLYYSILMFMQTVVINRMLATGFGIYFLGVIWYLVTYLSDYFKEKIGFLETMGDVVTDIFMGYLVEDAVIHAGIKQVCFLMGMQVFIMLLLFFLSMHFAGKTDLAKGGTFYFSWAKYLFIVISVLWLGVIVLSGNDYTSKWSVFTVTVQIFAIIFAAWGLNYITSEKKEG